MTIFLDEQLDKVYLTENFEKILPRLKSIVPALNDSLKNGNLFKARTLLNKFDDVPLEELVTAAEKKGKRFYTDSKRKMKGDKSEAQKVLVLMNTSLLAMKSVAKDSTLLQQIDSALSKLNEISKKYSGYLIGQGFTLVFLMSLLSWFFGFIPIITQSFIMSYNIGILLIWFGILFLVLRIVLNTYFSLKGIK